MNSRGYIDVTFDDLDGQAVDPETILDAGAELTLASGGDKIVVDGTPVLVIGTVSTYRYFFTGYTGGALVATFLAGSWADTAGNGVTAAQLAAAATAGTGHRGLYIDVVFDPTNDADVDAASILDGSAEFTLTGASSENLVANGVVQLSATTFRYLFTGQLDTGTVNVSFVAGSWGDTEGNAGVASTQSFKVITQSSSFFIELSGGIILDVGGFLGEPVMELKAAVTLEIDPARKVFELSFSGQLKIIKLGTVGATAGRFVLDMSNTLSNTPQFWGVATLETNFSSLEQYGLFLFAKGTLQINTTDFKKTETLLVHHKLFLDAPSYACSNKFQHRCDLQFLLPHLPFQNQEHEGLFHCLLLIHLQTLYPVLFHY